MIICGQLGRSRTRLKKRKTLSGKEGNQNVRITPISARPIRLRTCLTRNALRLSESRNVLNDPVASCAMCPAPVSHAEQWITGAKVTFAELQKPWFRQGELLLTQDDGRVQGGLL